MPERILRGPKTPIRVAYNESIHGSSRPQARDVFVCNSQGTRRGCCRERGIIHDRHGVERSKSLSRTREHARFRAFFAARFSSSSRGEKNLDAISDGSRRERHNGCILCFACDPNNRLKRFANDAFECSVEQRVVQVSDR